MSAAVHTLPARPATMLHLFRATVVDAAGQRTSGLVSAPTGQAAIDTLVQQHGLDGQHFRFTSAKLITTHRPSDWADFASTEPPPAASLDPQPLHEVDEHWPEPEAEARTHRRAAQLLELDRAALHRRRFAPAPAAPAVTVSTAIPFGSTPAQRAAALATHAAMVADPGWLLAREARALRDQAMVDVIQRSARHDGSDAAAHIPPPAQAAPTPRRPTWLHPAARRHLPHALAIAGLAALGAVLVVVAVVVREAA